ncbi:Zinc D-Ala-D-Ala carboxypeptidase [Ferriphaselus amnicola]|uniref:Zinc D-Ala-D-Ala carboxypeptidase n=1 Tax=Ferriphaselus amnicola TaxID=1188319 RepID=A0A2Z6GD65_9PROT|nr:N-acetylmuramidase family protein [Ferriphaselus amnicola]BBE51135.1 Zinc D-Ala-D-Ala carboxypeptidase [Ferriphaselus amnicola]
MKQGDTGDAVRVLQQQLLSTGYGFPLVVDGWYGESTEEAVKDFQRRKSIVVDGIAGPKTLALLSGKADPGFISHFDLERAAARLAVPVASICAVNEVESRGHGFLDDGRPVILFERHVMYQRLAAKGIEVEPISRRFPNLIHTARGGYMGGSAEHMRLAAASQIDRDCALESCSWGLFQIMGYHWQALGYATLDEFTTAMRLSESGHLDAFVRFILSEPPLLKALRARKWADFARLYNGPAYKDNLYDVKLARAYDRYATTEGAAA